MPEFHGTRTTPNVMRAVFFLLIAALFVLLPISTHAELSIEAWQAEGIALERETGVPRFRLPENIPPQQSPSKELVHCTIGLAGYTSYVSIWLKGADCDAWLKNAKDYNEKYGRVLEQAKNRHIAEQNRAAEAMRQQQAGPGRAIIYALFLCFPKIGQCEIVGAPRVTFAGVMPATTFQTLADCEDYARRMSGLVTPPTEGRFRLPNGLWYECRERQVETWERMQ